MGLETARAGVKGPKNKEHKTVVPAPRSFNEVVSLQANVSLRGNSVNERNFASMTWILGSSPRMTGCGGKNKKIKNTVCKKWQNMLK